MSSTYSKPASIEAFVERWERFAHGQANPDALGQIRRWLLSTDLDAARLPGGMARHEVFDSLTADENMCVAFLRSMSFDREDTHRVSSFIEGGFKMPEHLARRSTFIAKQANQLVLLGEHFGISSTDRSPVEFFQETFSRFDEVVANLISTSRLEEFWSRGRTSHIDKYRKMVTDLLVDRPEAELFYDQNGVPFIEIVLFAPKTLSFEGYDWTNLCTLRLRMHPHVNSAAICLCVHSKRNASVQRLRNGVGRIHPHVDRHNGEICFGEAANMSHILRSQEYRLVELVDLCIATLSNYNDDSPFWHLTRNGEQVCTVCEASNMNGSMRTVQEWMDHNNEILACHHFPHLSPDRLHHSSPGMTWESARRQVMCNSCYSDQYVFIHSKDYEDYENNSRMLVAWTGSTHVAPMLPYIGSGPSHQAPLYEDLPRWYDDTVMPLIEGAIARRLKDPLSVSHPLQILRSIRTYMQNAFMKEHFTHAQHQHIEEAIRTLTSPVEQDPAQTPSEGSEVVQAC